MPGDEDVAHSGQRGRCPIPSTHDKLLEAHWFLHEMADYYHRPDQFRYMFSAFLQAARNITWVMQKELSRTDGFREWYAEKQSAMAENAALRTLNQLRVKTTKKEALFAASECWGGDFKHGRQKSGTTLPLPANVSSDVGVMRLRRAWDGWLHPHRVFIGEEFGVERRWKLPEVEDRELLEYSTCCWEALAAVVSEAHVFAGGEATAGHSLWAPGPRIPAAP